MEPIHRLAGQVGRGTDMAAAIAAVAACFSVSDLCFGHGTATAEDEAAWLVAAVLGWPGDPQDRGLTAGEADRILQLAGQRVTTRKPLAYLLNEGWLAGLRFHVDERVLVPRSPLAELIEYQLAPWVSQTPGLRALDLGTGSGCLAIAMARYLPGCTVDATDRDADALVVARCNVSRHQLAHRVRVLRSDLFAGLGGTCYDVIVSNPPYVPAASFEALPAEYGHEPGVALVAGVDGLDLVRQILLAAGDHLKAEGVLIMEVGEAAAPLIAAYPEIPFTWLEFARGGEGVLVLTADQLNEYFAG